MRMCSNPFLFGHVHYSSFSPLVFPFCLFTSCYFFFLSLEVRFREPYTCTDQWACEFVKNVKFIRNSGVETAVNEINVWSDVGRYKVPRRHVSMVLDQNQKNKFRHELERIGEDRFSCYPVSTSFILGTRWIQTLFCFFSLSPLCHSYSI